VYKSQSTQPDVFGWLIRCHPSRERHNGNAHLVWKASHYTRFVITRASAFSGWRLAVESEGNYYGNGYYVNNVVMVSYGAFPLACPESSSNNLEDGNPGGISAPGLERKDTATMETITSLQEAPTLAAVCQEADKEEAELTERTVLASSLELDPDGFVASKGSAEGREDRHAGPGCQRCRHDRKSGKENEREFVTCC